MKKIPLFMVMIFVAGVLTCSHSCFAETLILNDADLSRYAGDLYIEGEYFRSISEYKRLLYYFPNSSWRNEVTLQIGRAFMAGGSYDEAIDYWEFSFEEETNSDLTLKKMKILYGISLLDKDTLQPFRLRADRVKKAMSVFCSIEGTEKESVLIQDFVSDWKNLPPPEYKSPWLAGAMSAVIPGAGSIYSERQLEGVYAFFITTLFSLATVESFNSNRLELGYIFGFFSLAFYGGNIYTAANSVHKYNDQQDASRLNTLRKKHGIWFVPATIGQQGRF